MTKQEARKKLYSILHDDRLSWTPDSVEALQMAIDALGKDKDVGSKYEYHYDHTDCIWYRPEARNRCPVTCAQYRDGWNDAMNYIFRDGKGYRPYRRDAKYEDDQTGSE